LCRAETVLGFRQTSTQVTILEQEIKMFKQLTAIGTFYENYMIKRGRVEARNILLKQDIKTLEDIGISRHELLGGIKNWPWDGSATRQASTRQQVKEFKAIRELSNYTDRELQDIGINRGMIADAVKNGRPTFDDFQPPHRPSGKGVAERVA